VNARRDQDEARVVALLERLVANVEGLREDLRNGLELFATQSNCRDAVEPAADTAADPLQLLTAREVADLLRIDLRTLRELRHGGEFPGPLRIGRSLRWRRGVVAAFISEANT